MKFLVALTFIAVLGAVNAECPDACNGHGFCGQYDKCSCYRNWMGNSCESRTCPYDLAFVDVPRGDLDMDGDWDHNHITMGSQNNDRLGMEIWPIGAGTVDAFFDQEEEAHFYAECSNKGMCDRKSGLCDCFDGYEGTACRRVVCPNECSGHGTCETMQEFGQKFHRQSTGSETYVATSGGSTWDYTLWDRYKAQVCKCDPGYFGIDCSQRFCPRGDDPLTVGQQDETQILDVNCGATACSGTFRLAYVDTFGETWDTNPITLSGFDYAQTATHANNAGIGTRIATALKAIPNDVITDVAVTISAIADVLPGFAVHTGDAGTAAADPFKISHSAANNNKFLATNVLGHFGAHANAGELATAISLWQVGDCANKHSAFSALTPNAGTAGDIVTIADPGEPGANYGSRMCREAKNGFRAKITFTKNPGDLNALQCTGTTVATCTASDEKVLLGAFGKTGTGQNILTNMDLSTTLAVGDRIKNPWYDGTAAKGARWFEVKTTPVAPASADGADEFGTIGITVAVPTGAGAISAMQVPAAALYGKGTKELEECSHRGLCDYGAGVCECFNGYTYNDCSMQNALFA